MAKVTETTEKAVVPPRTFMVELSEEEMALLVLVQGSTSGYDIKEYIKKVLERRFDSEVKDAAKIVDEAKPDHYDLYTALRDAFNRD